MRKYMEDDFTDESRAETGNLIAAIEEADGYMMNEIVKAVVRWYAKAYPDWDVSFLSLHKDPKLRKKELRETFRYIKKYNKN